MKLTDLKIRSLRLGHPDVEQYIRYRKPKLKGKKNLSDEDSRNIFLLVYERDVVTAGIRITLNLDTHNDLNTEIRSGFSFKDSCSRKLNVDLGKLKTAELSSPAVCDEKKGLFEIAPTAQLLYRAAIKYCEKKRDRYSLPVLPLS